MHALTAVSAIYGAIAGGVILSLAASFWAGQRGQLFLADFGAVLGAPLLLFIIAGMRNVAMAGIVWPIVAAVLLMYAFAVKVFIFDRHGESRRNSMRFFYFAVLACLVAAVVVPAWYE